MSLRTCHLSRLFEQMDHFSSAKGLVVLLPRLLPLFESPPDSFITVHRHLEGTWGDLLQWLPIGLENGDSWR